ncbi:MAG: hypothetical protein JWP87_2186 [Labilithrix sp.]|nr:hypothetical protein [Labilithrix sp.]
MRRRPDEDFPADLVTPDEAIDLVIDAVLNGNDGLRNLTKQILKAQKRLRRAVDDDGWKAYLKLEEVVNERASAQMDLLLRCGLAHGSRSRR